MRRLVRVLLVLVLSLEPQYRLAAQTDADLATGVRQVKDGEFEAALVTLDTAVRRLASDPARKKDLVEGYVYLGYAYVGLGQEPLAKSKFQLALEHDRSLALSPEEFPAKMIRVFEEARKAYLTTASLEREAKKKRGKGAVILLGVGGAAAVGVGVAAAGGGSKPNQSPTATISVAPEGLALVGATLVAFAGTASDPDGDPLTYAWDFADGARGTGQSVTHVFQTEGSFNVTLTVNDARGASVTASRSVAARTLTGTWRIGDALDCELGFKIEHHGDALSGGVCHAVGAGCVGSFSGKVRNPRAVTLRWSGRCRGACCSLTGEGQVHENMQAIDGTMNCAAKEGQQGCCQCAGTAKPLSLTRQ